MENRLPAEHTNNKDNIFCFHFLRTIAMLYIIFVWHLDDYVNDLFLNKISLIMTLCFLGLFFFMSGYLLSSRYSFSGARDIVSFYMKRCTKLFPLYLLALLLFYLWGFIDLRLFFENTILVNIVTSNSVGTLWFVSLMFYFYMIFPLLHKVHFIRNELLLVLMIILTSFCLHTFFNLIDKRFVIYFPVFVSGVLYQKRKLELVISKEIFFIVLVFLLTSCLYVLLFSSGYIKNFFQYLFMTSFCLIGVQAASKFDPNIYIQKVVLKLSYTSFCMYLFHRIVFFEFNKYIIISDVRLKYFLMLCCSMPTLYFLSYIVQKIYDSILLHRKNKCNSC